MSTLLIISLFIQFIISIQISSFSVCRVHRDTEATRSENPARCSLQAGALQPHTTAWRAPAPWTLLSLCTAQGSVKFPVSSNISSSVTFVRAFGIVTSDIPILFQGNNWPSTMDNILQGRGHKWLLLTHFLFPTCIAAITIPLKPGFLNTHGRPQFGNNCNATSRGHEELRVHPHTLCYILHPLL